MYTRSAWVVFASLFIVGLALAPAYAEIARDVLINEIYISTPDYYDCSEFIELYNTTDTTVNLEGWVLTGVEYDQTCKEHHHQFPAGTEIASHGYLIVTQDDSVPGGDVGFKERFGFHADLEMWDNDLTGYEPDGTWENDDHPEVPNTICLNPDTFDDQIRFWPGAGDYGHKCGTYSGYEALWLYDGHPSTGNLIDAMEYRDPARCPNDSCPGVNGSDDDGFPGIADEGISLGRDESSTDTDTSYADFRYQYPSPGAQNVLNLPPDIWSLRYDPCVPSSSDNVTITCYATDAEGTVAEVKCFYSVRLSPDFAVTGFDSLVMSPTVGEDSLYHVDVPPQPDLSQIRFYVRATDNLGAAAYFPEAAPADDYGYSVGITPISDIQTVDSGDDTSYVMGQVKNISGIVTADRGTFDYPINYSGEDEVFVVQEAGGGPWSGIYVRDPSGSVPADIGDSVTLTGLVIESYAVTHLYLFSGCYQEHNEGCALPAPYGVPTGDLNTASTKAERYEGVLVEVGNVTITAPDLGYGEWQINDGSGTCIVDDAGYYSYQPDSSAVLKAVRGIGYYSFDDYKMEPRSDDDIIGPVRVYTVRYTPHAPTSFDQITVTAIVVSDTLLAQVKLHYSSNNGASWDSTDMVGSDSLFSLTIGPYPNHTVVDYYVEAWDSAGYQDRKPPLGSYDLLVGMRTIHEIQYVAKGGDTTSYYGEPVNVAGIVTAAPGEYSDHYFYIQNSYTSESPEFYGVMVYDRTGTVSASRGDSITVSGDAGEYYSETEIAMFFPEAITIHSSGNPVPTPYPVSTGMIDSAQAEPWEGVLVAVNTSEVTDEDVGFGEWEMSNTAPDTSCHVGRDAYYTYQPTLGENLHYVYGIVKYAYGDFMLEPRDDDDICEPAEAGIDDEPRVPLKLAMMVKPNPMTDGGSVRFALPWSGQVALKVYNVKGQLVDTLADERLEAGIHRTDWRGTNARGARVSSGIYFIRLETEQGSLVNKVVVSR